ncbi:MAG: hypothetical protein ACTSRS_06615 [Candidatus Helarchaeota archaeon]
MSLENPTIDFKLKVLLASRTKNELLQEIKEYNKKCDQIGEKERKLRGYTKPPYNSKEGVIEFLLERLSEEEKQAILDKHEEEYIQDLINLAAEYFKGSNPRESLQKIEFKDNSLKIVFKGWQWENETDLTVREDGTLENYECTCRTGKIEGFCPHIFVGILFLKKKQKFNPKKFLFSIPPETFQSVEQFIEWEEEGENITKQLTKENADIVLGDDYFIKVKGDVVRMRWGGERAGEATKDLAKENQEIEKYNQNIRAENAKITEENKRIEKRNREIVEGKRTGKKEKKKRLKKEKSLISTEKWVANKVIDKILATLKDKKHPRLREVYKDDYGVVPLILKTPDLKGKLLGKIIKINQELGTKFPNTEEELEKFLTQHL